MGKIKFTKNALKQQKDEFKRFRRYLPTLTLKKQQLQLEIAKAQSRLHELSQEKDVFRRSLGKWVAVFAEDVGMKDIVSIAKVHTKEGNIAGVDIPIFEKVDFIEKRYDLMTTPLWVDYGMAAVKDHTIILLKEKILNRQIELLREELRITTQRVNLFEKIKIPQAVENIRRIRIFLGDMSTAAVVTGKIAKQKIENKERQAVLI